jgi:Putative metallopeptidase
MKQLALTLALLLLIELPHSLAQDSVSAVWSDSKEHPRMSAYLRKNPGHLATLPKQFEKTLKFPRSLPVYFTDYGAINAAYNPGKHNITMGYEFYAFAFEIFVKAGYDAMEARQLADDSFAFVFLHEFGHAVIGELKLPVTGREEDCADEFATWVCANFLPQDGARLARAGALLFFYSSQGDQIRKFAWYDEHSFGLQRAYRIAADIEAHYPGSVPEVSAKIPRERIAEAVAQKDLKMAHWTRQLVPHLKVPVGGVTRLDPPVSKAEEGHLIPRLGSSEDPVIANLINKWRSSGAHQDLMTTFDTMFLWPRDVDVLFTDTGTKQSSYDKSKGRITISLDGLISIPGALQQAGATPRQASTLGEQISSYAIWYEVSRAFIGEMNIPYTGAPEDAANELTTILLASTPKGHAIGSGMFNWLGLQSQTRPAYIWTDQALDLQRMYDMVGYLYAAAPSVYQGQIEPIIPSKQRLLRYRYDFANKQQRWTELLRPYSEI